MNTIYCHGLPGSGAEIRGLAPDGAAPHILGPLDFEGFDAAAKGSNGVHMIGFSLGALTAIGLASQRPDIVKRLSLIAPAAPLELGDFLPHMAGAAVFKTAMKGDLPFKIFTALQRFGVSIAPNKIIQAMFAGSPPADTALLADPDFTDTLLEGLKLSLGPNNRSYRAAVRAYVQPWAHHLAKIKCPVTLYHGTHDNWAPIAMSYAIEKAITSDVDLIPYEGVGHYSALRHALPDVLTLEV